MQAFGEHAGDHVHCQLPVSAGSLNEAGTERVDKEDDDGVFARLQPCRDESVVKAAFDEFYGHAAIFGLTNQWIDAEGPFDYDLSWLVNSSATGEAKKWLRGQFEAAYDLDPEGATVIVAK